MSYKQTAMLETLRADFIRALDGPCRREYLAKGTCVVYVPVGAEVTRPPYPHDDTYLIVRWRGIPIYKVGYASSGPHTSSVWEEVGEVE